MPTLKNSTYLEYTSYGTTTATTVESAYNITGRAATDSINVAFILNRANDPSALLESNWATRQSTLAQLNDSGTLWSTYGARSDDYANARSILSSYGTIIGDAAGANGYVTSQDSRTIWVTLTADGFYRLFGQQAYQSGDMYYWNGELSVPTGLDLAGLWFDTAPWFGQVPATSPLATTPAPLVQGPQSIGNHLPKSEQNFSGDMGGNFYNFPLTGLRVDMPTIGLIEPGIGDAMATPDAKFLEALNKFRAAAGLPQPGEYYSVGVVSSTAYQQGNAGERSLDVGVVASAAQGAKMGLYAGSGFGNGANANVFTAYMGAIWDTVNNPAVLTSSFAIFQQSHPDSVFARAVRELFVDAALRNITVVSANNDYGSSWSMATGLAQQAIDMSSPHLLLVGGTSLTSLGAAPFDPTLSQAVDSLYQLAMAGDRATLWKLVEGGLQVMPSTVSGSSELSQMFFVEAVWNTFVVQDGYRTPLLGASDGGVDTTQDIPSYQSKFGLRPTSVNPGHATGRGAPDVSADAGGNMSYLTPGPTMEGMNYSSGTSAAAPLWASLMVQIDTIFRDQGLPQLGFAHDLLYTAAAIAPASFNDIVYGNNITSFIEGGAAPLIADAANNTTKIITLTGYGYEATSGYDLATGLGSPNGVLLARAMTAIAHSQMYFSSSPAMLERDGSDGWTSVDDQSLMFQMMSDSRLGIELDLGATRLGYENHASGRYAWTTLLAQQSLQADFDPNLVRLFDKQGHGFVAHSVVEAGERVAVKVGTAEARAIQGEMSSAFGFADFVTDHGVARVARPVAVAETAGGADDVTAVVRVRQNGEDSLSVTFYRVDDYTGTIGGIRPDQGGYEALAAGRAYQLATGGTALNGPGYGNYTQSGLLNVDAGDLIAMKLVNNTSSAVFWAFANANEKPANEHIGHLWNYGLNTWGWEDQRGGGDRDFNDLIVQLDFTSAAGRGWLT